MDLTGIAGLLRLSRLARKADAPRAMRSIVPSAAGEGSHHLGISSAVLDNPIAETALTPTLPRTRGREHTGFAASNPTR